MENRIVDFLKWKWKMFRLWLEVYNPFNPSLYCKDKELNSILKLLKDYEILDMRFDKVYKVGETWKEEFVEVEDKDNIYSYILFANGYGEPTHILKFWNANKYYSWMHKGSLYYYSDYFSQKEGQLLYSWEGKMPSNKIIFNFIKKIQTWQKLNPKSM